MPVNIIHILEAIKIEKHHGHRPVVAFGKREGVREGVREGKREGVHEPIIEQRSGVGPVVSANAVL